MKRINWVDSLVGSRIQNRRLALGLTVKALANAIDVSAQQFQKYEKGIDRVSAGHLYTIATIVDVKPAYFFDASLSGSEASEFSQFKSLIKTDDYKKLNIAFARIRDPDVRRTLLLMVEAIGAGSK